MKRITKTDNCYEVKDCLVDKRYLNSYYQDSFIVSDEVGGWLMTYASMYNTSNIGIKKKQELFTECIRRYSTRVVLPDDCAITSLSKTVNQHFNTLGIFLYDKLVIPNPNINFGIQTYRFKLAIINYKYSTYHTKHYEICEFIYTCNLQDYINKDIVHDAFMDYHNLLQDAAPHLYKETLERLERKFNKVYKEFRVFNNEEYIEISENCDEFDDKLVLIEYGINKNDDYFIIINEEYQQVFHNEKEYKQEVERLHYMQPINVIDLENYKTYDD